MKHSTSLITPILEDPSGNVFVKLTGPKARTQAAEAEFRKMVEGVRK